MPCCVKNEKRKIRIQNICRKQVETLPVEINSNNDFVKHETYYNINRIVRDCKAGSKVK